MNGGRWWWWWWFEWLPVATVVAAAAAQKGAPWGEGNCNGEPHLCRICTFSTHRPQKTVTVLYVVVGGQTTTTVDNVSANGHLPADWLSIDLAVGARVAIELERID